MEERAFKNGLVVSPNIPWSLSSLFLSLSLSLSLFLSVIVFGEKFRHDVRTAKGIGIDKVSAIVVGECYMYTTVYFLGKRQQ
jgi:hypothetical protein